jgi:hypothetical protein
MGNSTMRLVSTMKVAFVGLVTIGAVTAYGRLSTGSHYAGATAVVVDENGSMRVPSDYRTTYQTLGTWAVAADGSPGSKEMHVVYVSPGAIVSYRKDGHFADGTVLVKEVFETATNEMTTGTVSSAHQLKGWFLMVKDSVGRYPGNKLWGDGWGWAWFNASDPLKTTSTDYAADCQSCHVPAQASDWIYTNGYPPLSR